MKKIALLFFGSFILQNISAQQVYWADKVISFSSQYAEKEFSAQQVLGPPNALPVHGKSMVAWTPGIKAFRASITVGFEKAIQVQQIAIGENLLAGTIEKIFLYDEKGKEYQVYNNPNPQPKTPDKADMFNLNIPLTAYKANKLRLDINFSNFRNIPQIDCIGISPDTKRVVAKINTIDYTSSLPSPENLGTNINSQYNDMLPIISPDGSTLYFARKNAPENTGAEKKDDIYVSQRQPNGFWSKAINIGAPLNTDEHNFVCAISPDGNTMYLANRYDYRTEGQGVAVSQRQKNGVWSRPKPLNISNMYNKNKYACYHLSIDEKVMVMAIERDDTYGDMDLYVSFRYADGNWSEPMNMGADLNTAGAEASVFLAADGKTLYFSSNGHSGYGDLDMFMSKRLDNTWKNWTTPVNLGSKINTPGMDVYYTIPASGEYAYYSSERGGYGRNDIFRITLPKELRPDAVKLNQGGLYTNQEIEVPKLRPYQTAETSDLDKRIEELRRQLNNPTASSAPVDNKEINHIQKQESQIDSDLKKLEQQYQSLPVMSSTPQPPQSSYVLPSYPELNTPTYDASYDDKINDLKRQLEKVKLEQPATAKQVYTPQNSNNLSSYEQKLASYQQTPTATTTSSATTAKPTDKKLSAYEEKLKQLQTAQNQPAPEPAAPVRLPGKATATPEIKYEENDLPDNNTPEIVKIVTPQQPAATPTTPAVSPVPKSSDENLNAYEEKLRQLQANQNTQPAPTQQATRITPKVNEIPAVTETIRTEPAQPENSTTLVIPELPSTGLAPATPTSNPDFEKWEQQRKSLEDSLQMLQSQKEQIAQKNQEEQKNADNLQKQQQELLGEKEQIALAIAQMQLERDQLALEKERLENERKKLDALKNQQYKDINALKRELDSLQTIQTNAKTNQAVAELSIDDELSKLNKKVGEKVALKNVFFVVNASFIQSKSYADLDKLALYLIKNKELVMEVGGHTNGLCDDAFCNELSNKRAKSVVDYLVTKGVPANRLSYKGYGKTQNIADNGTEQGRKLNQRVEITITKIQ